jgi:23S rRNA (adenine2030-N6)-methyltransferase
VNYRHQFHAGNFADVLKHALLVRLARALQRKPGGLLLLDTHAGRGSYDLAAAAQGDTLARAPEWPDGIGRLWARDDVPPELSEYVALVGKYESEHGGAAGTGDYFVNCRSGFIPDMSGVKPDLHRPIAKCGTPEADTRARGPTASEPLDASKLPVPPPAAPRFYPGSPWLLRELARAQDRVALCELHPEEFETLRAELGGGRGVSAQRLDGYTAVRAMLPPPERRALVLIDPPFEAQDEFGKIVTALGAGLRRLPGGTFAVWYPLTERARTEEFFARLGELGLPPTFTVELTVHPAAAKLRGCGLMVVNPPWQFDREARTLAEWLANALAQSPGGGAELRWLVPER